ncbi:hypothetical protein SAMN05421640_0256 [Ekhidna lutea]|uniref:ATPase n=1 Tax=Ekhidna lutea TaxID=447679 RepID=A0A239EQ80_EKHLU|nr:DUF4175 family protein [Ekhidna lutea]SNS46418.1 hypothetical protein SAMN05421640_0256 [Ekhidna lutea]
MSGLEEIKYKLASFKKRYYFRQIILGILGFLILNTVFFVGINGLEHKFWLGVTGRAILFFSFILLVFISFYSLIIRPGLQLAKIKKGLSDEDAAKEISKHFSELEDRLINTLQLGNQGNNDLLLAAIEKKSQDFKRFKFVQAVDFRPAKKYGIILFIVIVGFSLVSFINPSLISESSKRIVNFKKEYVPKAPFAFFVQNKSLEAFRGEDFTLTTKVDGNQLPESVYLIIDEKRYASAYSLKDKTFSHTFPKIQTDKKIQFEAAGFQSKTYNVRVRNRPDLVSMLIRVSEPNYTGGQIRTIENTGDLTILEGSTVLWQINTLASDSASIILNEKELRLSRTDESGFSLEERVFNDGSYEIELFNEFSKNKSELMYSIDVIEDEFPEIAAQYFPDSIGFEFLTLAGSISDDYGFTGLFINYRKQKQKEYTRIPLDINKKAGSQSFYANWNLDSLNIQQGQSLEVFISVKDNDQVNGPKETKANVFILQTPGSDEIDALISEKQDGVEDQLGDTEKKAEEIAERLEEIENRLKSEQKVDWQEKKLLNDIIEDREKLNEEIEKLKKQHEDLMKSSNRFQKQSEQLQEKNQKMQQLLDELMDEETKKLYEKLKELLKENNPSDQEVSQELNELKKSEQNLERDLERALELFKRLKMESTLEQNLQKLDTLSNKQETAADENSGKEEQEEINKEFDDFRDKMDQVQKMNQELKRPEALEDFELEERQIAKELREIMEQLEKESGDQNEGEKNQEGEENDSSESEEDTGENSEKENNQSSDSKPGENADKKEQNENQQGQQSQKSQQQKSKSTQQKQKNAAQKMKNLSKKLQNMQGGMQMEMMQANLDQLRDILDNLVKLSFNQEEIMLEMRQVSQSDPRFLELSQNQLKLKDDAKVIQDSLLSLASKVVQISSYVTREVGSINDNIDEAIDYLKDRNRGRALSSQQFAMTSINNLALLLDDTMQQMQMAMSEAMGNSSSGKKDQSQSMPDLQEMQNQLGEQINELKGSGKSGRELSEELARLAAEQEMIRRQMEMLKEAEDGKPGGGIGGDDLKRAIDMMEQNEVDLVNKRLTQQLINRQKQIMTRMLEAEKAQRNQEMDEEREAQKPSVISREIPPGFEKYLELKKKEIELLKTIPIELNPFYKKEVNDYFRRLSSDEEND